MANVRIFTNSVSDLTPALAEEFGITLVPDAVIFGDEQLLNNIDITPPVLYERLAKAEKLPTTSQPSIGLYAEYFRKAEGADAIICICLTSRMSGSYNTACAAAKLLAEQGFPTPVYVYDSLQICFTLALLAIEAGRMAQQGADAQEILDYLDRAHGHMNCFFVTESLQYARKGGRSGAIRLLAADLLKIKPILTFTDGMIHDDGFVRTVDAGIQKFLDNYKRLAQKGTDVFIYHSQREELANAFADRLRAIDPEATVRVEWVGAVIGIYTGPGCIGIAFREPHA